MTARLDCLVLLEDTLHKDRAWLLANQDYELKNTAVEHLKNVLTRRARHEPLAFIRGRSEFYGRQFVVSKDVLEPRPESETMIQLLKELDVFNPSKAAATPTASQSAHTDGSAVKTPQTAPKTVTEAVFDPQFVRIADVGTGSGALGITAALELKNASVDLLDISSPALAIAKTNVDLFTLNISTIESDLLAATTFDYQVLLCNLPYVPDDYEINEAAKHEPALALFGGTDGLDLYRRLFDQITQTSHQVLYILTEALPSQHEALTSLADEHSFALVKTDDFIQVFKHKTS